MSTAILRCGKRRLALDRPQVMGILNVTPDSFSDGGRFDSLNTALSQAAGMIEAGAAIIDIGGESTRPGAGAVTVQEELDRVMPVLESVVQRFDVLVSIDTSKAEVMRAATAAGAGLINDVRALQEPGAMAVAAESDAALCLMHMQGEPRSMQVRPRYDDVLAEVEQFLLERRNEALAQGIAPDRLVLDPGFGFGKSLSHNIALLRGVSRLSELGPVLVGVSRKRMIGGLLGDDNIDRTTGSVIASLLGVQRGAAIVRVHDVAPMVQALSVYQHIEGTAGGT